MLHASFSKIKKYSLAHLVSPFKLLYGISLCLVVSLSNATNYTQELTISEEMAPKIPAEEIVWLDVGQKNKTFALYKKSRVSKINGGIIVLHNNNENPDWPVITHSLREYFSDHAWATLSIQMPMLPESPDKLLMTELYQLTKDRITAGIEFLNANSITRKIIIAQGMSANMALQYTANESSAKIIHSLIIIGAYDNEWLKSSDYVQQISINLLDVFAEHDWPEILASGKKRLSVANLASQLRPAPQNIIKSSKLEALALKKTGNLRYRQEIIPGANHDLDIQNEELLKLIRGWLDRFEDS